MAETTTRTGPTVDVVTTDGSDAGSLDPLEESLDELVRVADSLVDNLTADSPELEEPDEAPSAESRRQALQETLDRLDHLIEDPSPPPVSAEVQLNGDHGEDISERLDALLTTEPDAAESLDVLVGSTLNETLGVDETEAVATPAPTTVPVVEEPAQHPSGSTRSNPSPAVALTPELDSQTATSLPAKTLRRPTTIHWLLVVIALLGTAAGVYWYLQTPTAPSAGADETPMPDPPVVYTKPPHSDRDPALGRGMLGEATPARADSARLEPVASRPDAAVAAQSAATTENTPPSPEPAQTEPVIEPAAPDDATISYAAPTTENTPPSPEPAQTEPVIEPAAPEPDEATVSYAAPTAEPSTEKTAASAGSTTAPQTASIGATLIPAPVEAVRAEPTAPVAIPADQPPVVIDRVEPVFDSNSIQRGETQTVVLRVLVSESGRVARVVVDESVKGSETEVAAINAVLRWTYQPALENGQPIRRWTTERFEFGQRPD